MLNENIEILSEKLFDDEKIESIYKQINLIKSNQREKVLLELSKVLGSKPKRPLYYIQHEISQLPKYGTRNIMRFCGDYIDQLLKFMLEDKKNRIKWFRGPLGKKIRKLQKHLDPKLFDELEECNKIYTNAKHEFHHSIDKSYFNYQDAVFMIYITKDLASKILPLSEGARDYNDHGQNFYRYDPID